MSTHNFNWYISQFQLNTAKYRRLRIDKSGLPQGKTSEKQDTHIHNLCHYFTFAPDHPRPIPPVCTYDDKLLWNCDAIHKSVGYILATNPSTVPSIRLERGMEVTTHTHKPTRYNMHDMARPQKHPSFETLYNLKWARGTPLPTVRSLVSRSAKILQRNFRVFALKNQSILDEVVHHEFIP